MPIAVRTRHDPPPSLPELPTLSVRREDSVAVMAQLQQRTEDEINRRFANGHYAYVAYIDAQPVAWGWAATRSAAIGELGFSFDIAARDRYLWNFVTLSEFRGRGIYPRLVNAIVHAESVSADRFWIIYAPENRASGTGVRRAGFVDVADLSFAVDGTPALYDLLPGGARIAARVLGVAASSKPLAPCWRCERAGRSATHACAAGTCQCDYQQPSSGCAA